MKAGWQVKNLGDLCQVIGGGTPLKDKAEYYSGDIHWATIVGEQRQIVEKLDALSAETPRLESIYRQKLAALDSLKKSLLDQAFTGEL